MSIIMIKNRTKNFFIAALCVSPNAIEKTPTITNSIYFMISEK